jgi:arginine decarboxylase
MRNPFYGKPKNFLIVAAKGIGKTGLNAFDRALHEAGISDYNLVKISSIIPPGAKEVEEIKLPKGSLLPIAYGAITSSEEGRIISAAIAVGIPERESECGVIMELADYIKEEEARERVKFMAEEALLMRSGGVKKIIVKSVSLKVKEFSCAFAGVALW